MVIGGAGWCMCLYGLYVYMCLFVSWVFIKVPGSGIWFLLLIALINLVM